MSFATDVIRATVAQSIPLVSLGSSYSFTVTMTGAITSQVAIVNPPVGLLGSLSSWAANVTSANTVTITLKAGLAISAGSQTFVVAVV